ncbi:MAG: AAA family ATPase, partial [Spirochaetales bacterium]|nr:AAA family ATPase [Spirochaetales bacterium]
MLEELHVEGYALIDSISIIFSKGLNILSGETGAGKSILIGALSLLLGEKAGIESIRAGNNEAKVSGVFRVDGSRDAQRWLDDRGIEPEDGTVILRRQLRRAGKGQIFIQSVPVTRSDIQELTGFLFDMHGQHEHQSLLKVATHRVLIDKFGGHEELSENFHSQFLRLAELKKELGSLESDEQDRIREQSFLEFAVKEIKSASLAPGEEEELQLELKVLSQGEKLYSLLQEFHDQVAENSGGSLSNLRQGIQNLRDMADIDNELSSYRDRLEAAFYEIEDVSDSIRHYQENVDFSRERLEICEDRMASIRKLEKKYGATITDVIAYAEECRAKLSRIESW